MINIFDMESLSKIISDIESNQNQKRKRKEWDNSQIYNGEVVYYTEKRLQEIWPDTYSDFTKSGINIAKKIVDKIAVSYCEKPKRFLDSGDTESDFYNEILETAGGNHIFQLFDENSVLHKYSAMQVFYDYDINDDAQIKMRTLDPTQFDRVVDDFGKTLMVIVSKPNETGKTQISGDKRDAIVQDAPEDEERRVYEIYTDHNYMVVHISGSNNEGLKIYPQTDENNLDFINPIGVIPFAFYQKGDNTRLPVPSSLGAETTTVNEIMSVILTGGTLNTFGNLVVKHPAKQNLPDTMAASLFAYLKLPQLGGEEKETTADYINPQSDITAFREALAAYAISILDDHGITAGQSLKGETEHFSSGLDRALASADTTKEVNKLKQSYQTIENQIFNIIKAITEITGMFKFRSERITIIFNKEKPLTSESDLIANVRAKLELGIITKAKAIIELEPNITLEDAKAIIEEVNKERTELAFNSMGENDNGIIQE